MADVTSLLKVQFEEIARVGTEKVHLLGGAVVLFRRRVITTGVASLYFVLLGGHISSLW
jgi:hypothetical protein